MKIIFSLVCFITILFSGEFKTPTNIEPSGITYLNETFYVVSDNGYICSYKGTFSCHKEKKRDLEGITNNGSELIVVEEGKENILYLDAQLNVKEKYSVEREFKGSLILNKDGDGFEGIAFYSKKGNKEFFFVANQSDNFEGDDKSAILFVEINRGFFGDVKILNYFPMQIKDISDLFFKDGELYVLSDTENKIFIFEFNQNKLTYKREIKVNGVDQEGLVIVNNKIYLAQDSGNIIF